jgi:hypothetical protein
MANYLKGIGDIPTRVNEILPSLDARILKFIIGHTSGVISGELNEFSATTVDRGVVVRSGLCQAHGYFGCCDTETQFNFVMPSGTQYVQIYAEIDLSVVPNRFEIKATAMSNSTAFSPRQDNLRTTTNGKFQLWLWQATLTSTTITLADKRVFIYKPSDAVTAENYTASGGIATKFSSVDATAATKAPLANPVFTGTPTITSVPTTATLSASLNGNKTSEVTQGGTISPGFYRVELGGGAGATGGQNGGRSTTGGHGGNGGSLTATVYIPYAVTYRLTAGGGGTNGTSGTMGTNTAGGDGGGGGGASIFLVPQLGILLAAYGGGGGSGAGGTGNTSGNGVHAQAGGAGGSGGIVTGGSTGTGDSGYGGGGNSRNLVAVYNADFGVSGGGSGPANGASNNGTAGGNNLTTTTGGGAVWTDADAGNGWARLYRLS